MTVKEAFYKLLIRHGVSVYPPHVLEHLTEEEMDRLFDIQQWLHGLASDNMVRLYGPCFGYHPNLPSNIDEATELTPCEEEEFVMRLGECQPKTSLSETV